MEVEGSGQCYNLQCDEGDTLHLFCFQLKIRNKTMKLKSGIHSFIKVRTRQENELAKGEFLCLDLGSKYKESSSNSVTLITKQWFFLFCFSFCKFIYHFFEMQWEWGGSDLQSAGSLSTCCEHPGLGLRSQEPETPFGFPNEWQGPNHLGHQQMSSKRC